VTIVTKKKWVPFAKATTIVRDHLKLTTSAAETLLRGALHDLRTRRDAQLGAQLEASYEERKTLAGKRPTGELGSALALLSASAAHGAREQILAENPLINVDDLESWLRQQELQTSAPVRKESSPAHGGAQVVERPRTARESDIRDELRTVYQEPANNRPNVRDVAEVAVPRLQARGLLASKRRITEIAGEQEFKQFRRPPGKTRASERPK
jgi:hypothetical protein